MVVTGIGSFFALCCLGVLGFSLLFRILPMSFTAPDFIPGQTLGEGEALAFSYMRLDMLRPFALYSYEDARGFRPLSEGRVGSDVQPAWSPDGTRLAYQSVYGWSTRIFLIAADGKNRREITADDMHKGHLRWSPDGTRLAYLAYPQGPDGPLLISPELCVIEISTGVTHRTPAGNVMDLVWTPDGPALLAIVRADELVTLEMYDADGNHARRIAEADYLREAFTIVLSPDASQVAYFTPGPDPDHETLNISAIDGSATITSPTRWVEGSLAWSPDSTKIAFVALTDDYEYALFVMDAKRAGLQELMVVNTGDESGEIAPAHPVWSPDGARLAISSYEDPEGPAVFVMEPDGSARRQVFAATGIGSMVYDLAWRPGE